MQFDQIKRREFITLISGAAVAWPLVARAQQPERMRRISALLPFASDDPEAQVRVGGVPAGAAAVGRRMDSQAISLLNVQHERERHRPGIEAIPDLSA